MITYPSANRGKAPRGHAQGPVLIIGGGAVGSALAGQLARSGIHCRSVTDFASLDGRTQSIARASAVVAATDDPRAGSLINRECLKAAKPVVFASAVGEVLWVDPRRGGMPCYECAALSQPPGGGARGDHSGPASVDAVVHVTASVLRGLLQPGTPPARRLDKTRNLILLSGGQAVSLVKVDLPAQPCPACGQSAAAPPVRGPVPRSRRGEFWPGFVPSGRRTLALAAVLAAALVVGGCVSWQNVLPFGRHLGAGRASTGGPVIRTVSPGAVGVMASLPPSHGGTPSQSMSPTPTASNATSAPGTSPSQGSTPASVPGSSGRGPADCIASPHLCGFPDASNTGVPAGTSLTVVPDNLPNCPHPDTTNCSPPANGSLGYGWIWDHRGWIAVATPGGVVQDVSTNGDIDVKAPNVTIKDVLVNCSCGQSGWEVIFRDTDTGAVANADNGTIEDSTLTDPTSTTGVDVVEEGGVGGMRIIRSNLSGVGTGVHNGNDSTPDLIQDSYIHGLANCCGMHDEDVHIDTGGAMTISHNTFVNQLDQTATVIINQDAPPAPSNVTINDNLLAGGGYTIYGGDDGAGYTGPATYIKITNNRISPLFYASFGQYGWLTSYDGNTGNVCSGNVNDATNAPLSC